MHKAVELNTDSVSDEFERRLPTDDGAQAYVGLRGGAHCGISMSKITILNLK